MAQVDYGSLAQVAVAPSGVEPTRSYLEQLSVPTVFRGAYASTPLVKAGLESFGAVQQELLRHYSRKQILAYRADSASNGRIFYRDDFKGFNYKSGHTTLDVFFRAYQANIDREDGYTYYVGSTNVREVFPSFIQEHPCVEGDQVVSNLWFGGRSKVAAHYDAPLNLACNLVGERRFTLFPPNQVANLYPGPVAFAPGGQEISLVDFDNVDTEAFPNFNDALEHAVTVTLQPGDALFVPSMWWHHVEGLSEFNVLYNHWWRTTEIAYGSPSNALLNAVLSIRSLPKEQREAWKGIFDYYVFDDPDALTERLPEGARGFLEVPLGRESAIALAQTIKQRGG